MKAFNQEQDFINDFPNLSREQLMDKYQLSASQYERIRKKNNLIKRESRITDAEVEFIKQNYETMSDREIGEALGRAANTVYQVRKKYNLLRGEYAKSTNSDIDREYSICIWWLTGASIDEIRVLYNGVRGVNVKKALKSKEKMAKAIRAIQRFGTFPIVRPEREIFKMSGLEVKLNDR